MSGEAKHRYLLVDDDETFRGRLARALRERGLEVAEAGDGATALDIARQGGQSRAVVDMRMPGMQGLEVVRELRALDPPLDVVVLTGYGSIATAVEAMRLGAHNYLTKPADADEILCAFDAEPAAPPEPSEVPSLARAEWEHINRVLADCGGNVSQAARLLGLHRRSLQRKLAKYPVRR